MVSGRRRHAQPSGQGAVRRSGRDQARPRRLSARGSSAMRPLSVGRLVSLVRCPDGVAKQCFFQKHGTAGLAPSLQDDAGAPESDGKRRLSLARPTIRARAGRADRRAGVPHLGLHNDDIEHPDRIVFDLDPDPCPLPHREAGRVRHARRARRARPADFALLTGGKGIHIVLSEAARMNGTVVKGFAGTSPSHDGARSRSASSPP